MEPEMRNLRAFLDSLEYAEGRVKAPHPKRGRFPFITISRQAGAGGHQLAHAIVDDVLAKEKDPVFAGWQMFDRQIYKVVTEDPKLRISMENYIEKEYRSQIDDAMNAMILGTTDQDLVIHRVFRAIRKLATHGQVVLIGRGAALVTRTLPLGVHLRLVAPLEIRVERMAKMLDKTRKEADYLVRDQDKAREKLIRKHFRQDINDPLLYDMVYNTSDISLEFIALSAVEIAKQRYARAKKADEDEDAFPASAAS